MSTYKLSPSDFAFLWEQCKRCFYLKVVHRIRQPSMPMAGIFKRIEGLQMEFYDGKPAREISPDLPDGIIRCGERWVESDVIRPPGRETGCYVLGKVDSLLEFEDGSWGILDFKTTQTRGEHIPKYTRQLHAYAFGVEHPSKAPLGPGRERLSLPRVSTIGLLCFEPSVMSQPDPGSQAYQGEVRWIEMVRDDDTFFSFVGEVVELLEGPVPEPDANCDWCRYGTELKRRDLTAGPPAASGAGSACPKCNSPMIRRQSRRGPFLGCSRFPACRGTRDL